MSKIINNFDTFLNESFPPSSPGDGGVIGAERFLEDFITIQLVDYYGSMSYVTHKPREGEYVLDNEKKNDGSLRKNVWAEICLPEDDYLEAKMKLENEYEEFYVVKKLREEAQKVYPGWNTSVLSNDTDNTITLQISDVSLEENKKSGLKGFGMFESEIDKA